jgi:phosphoglycolate phosphatase
MVARLWYGLSVALCVFDLDHTLIQTPLDLAAMAIDMRTLIERTHGPLPTRTERYRVGELIAHCQTRAPALEAAVWEVALDHERRAMEVAALEPGALAAVVGARRSGFATAIWTNNARELAVPALARLGLTDELDLVVTRDDMRALKPDPDGWRVIAEHFGKLANSAGNPRNAVVVGDSWVDGVAAAKAGVSFIAYRARQEDLDRWQVTPIVHLADLALLPAWLAAQRNGRP